jgi:hypothetical protein
MLFHAEDRLTGVLSSHSALSGYCLATVWLLSGYCRKISMISQGPVFIGFWATDRDPKLRTRVRFQSPAPPPPAPRILVWNRAANGVRV